MKLWSKGRALGLLASLGTAVALGCDKNYQPGVTGPAGFAVVITDRHGFNPDSIEIPGGSTVTFGWDGANSRQHNVVFTDTTFSSVTQVYGTTAFTFGSGRHYHYMCTVHGEHGVIVAH